VRLLGPARAATMMFLVPVFGLGFAFVLLGETVTVVQAVGSVLMLTGAWLAVTHRQRFTTSRISMKISD
jgi:drug/metabolite transporter (DMT)-like permease